MNLKATFMGGDGNNDPTLIKTAGPAAEGMLISTSPLPQFLSSAKGFVDQYTKQYGHGPGPYSAYEYDAVGVLAQAIGSAKSTEPGAINTALAGIKDYHGITGTIGFNAKGDRAEVSYIIATVKNGEFTPYQRLSDAGKWEAMK